MLFFTDIYRRPSIESLIVGGVLVFSLLVHEYGHALTAVFFGARPTITLEAFGGNAQYNGSGISAKQRFLITLNGPLFESLLIVLPFYLLKTGVFEGNYYMQYFLEVTMRLNIWWCLLNLIPIVPLDGGYIVRYLLVNRFGEAGYKTSFVISLMCVAIVAPYLFYQGFLFFGVLLVIYGIQNFQNYQKVRVSLGEVNPFGSYLKAVEAIKNGEIDSGKTLLSKLLKCEDLKIRNSAIEALAKVYCQENEKQKAYGLLMKADHQFLKEGKCLLCRLAFEEKNYELVCHYSREIYQIEPSFEIAVLNSQAFAGMSQPVLADGWLKTASGFEDVSEEKIKAVLEDPIYDAVRKLMDADMEIGLWESKAAKEIDKTNV